MQHSLAHREALGACPAKSVYWGGVGREVESQRIGKDFKFESTGASQLMQ